PNAGARTLSVDAGYTVNDGNGGNNYTVSLDTHAGTIDPRPLTISALTDSKTYDGTRASAKTPTADDLQLGDTLDATQRFDSKNEIGRASWRDTYNVNDGNGGANYSVTLATAPGSIDQRGLTVSATADSHVEDRTRLATA